MTQEVRRGRGRPKNKASELEIYLKQLVNALDEIPTLKSMAWFDLENPPQTPEDFIEMIKSHTDNTRRMMFAYGIADYEYAITGVEWDYDKIEDNMYIKLSVFIFKEEQRKLVVNKKFQIN